MVKEKVDGKNWEGYCCGGHKRWHGGGGGGGAFYGLGFVGALIYYLQGSTTFMEGVVALLKAIVWPAYLIHKVLTILQM